MKNLFRPHLSFYELKHGLKFHILFRRYCIFSGRPSWPAGNLPSWQKAFKNTVSSKKDCSFAVKESQSLNQINSCRHGLKFDMRKTTGFRTPPLPRKRESSQNPFQNLIRRSLFLVFSLSLPVCYGDFSKPAPDKASDPFKVEEMAQGLGVIWGMVFLNEKEILFTEREGHFKKLNLKTKQVQSLSGAPEVYAKGQGGLMDVALHPQFQKNKKVYFSYSKKKGRKQTTAVAVGILKRKRLVRVKDIFEAQPTVSSSIHFGSRLVFDKQGFLFVTVGDRGKRHSAQSLKTHLGKILRLTDRGAPPPDNPFVSIKGARPEIWSFGHRNPQGLFIHPETGELWEQEHGPRGGDEINRIQKGKNYGWPVITFGREYWGPSIGEGTAKKGMEQPVKDFTPSIAPASLLIYSGKTFKKWKGDFFSAALVRTHLNRLKITKGKVKEEERLLSHLKHRVREVIEGPDGLIYLSTDEGKILRLVPFNN